MNKLILIGNLTRDPEFKNAGGSDLVNGSIATTYKYKSGNETKEETEFTEFVIWGKRAISFAEYTSKGKKVMLEGRKQTQQWTTPEGEKRSKVIMNVENFEFLSPKGEQSSQPRKHDPMDQANQDDYDGYDPNDDDIPF